MQKHKINLFRGSNNNVAKRIIDCAKQNSIQTIVRITADCPIIDSNIIDKCIKLYYKNNKTYTSNTLKLTYPDGLDVEVFNLNTLIKSQNISKNSYNKEHVTFFIRVSKLFKKNNIKNNIDYSNRRWTLDNYSDFLFLKSYKIFFPNIYFSWKDLIKVEKRKIINKFTKEMI